MSIAAPEIDDLDATEDGAPFTLPTRRTTEDTEMDMTPMIDMTFQLLIFFLVTFKSDPAASIPLPSAKFGSAVPSRNAIIVSVQKGEGINPAKIYKGFANDPKNLINTTDLKEIESQLMDYIQTEADRGEKTMVIIQAGKDVKHRDVAAVANSVKSIVQIQQLYVAVLEVH
ncbi:MAG: ExbD/TolR family protein [Pirellulaceae bacterium]